MNTNLSNTMEFVISAEYDLFYSRNKFYGPEEYHSNFYWKIHIRQKRKKTVSYGLECRPMREWGNQTSLTARIESCVTPNAENAKSKTSVFQFDSKDSNQIFWIHGYKPASQSKVEFKVEITGIVGSGVITNAFLSTNETILLIVEGKKFEFPKMFITSHFPSNLPENQKEFTMNASVEDFEKLLLVLDGANIIEDENVVSILRLAKNYGVESVIRKSEQFLIKHSKKPTEQLTKIAEDFKLDLLKMVKVLQTQNRVKDLLLSRKPPQPMDKIMESLECPVCYITYTNIPMVLQCGHTLCYSCLIRLRNDMCPICCRYFYPGNAQPNWGLKNVIEAVFPNLTIKAKVRTPNVQNEVSSEFEHHDPEADRCSIM